MQAFAVLFSLLLIAFLTKLPSKVWRSLGLGLIPISSWVWVLSVAAAWVAYENGHIRVSGGSIALAVVVTVGTSLINRRPASITTLSAPGLSEPDLPVIEGGEDLLGRQALMESLVSMILLDPPAIIAVTGKYGEGKTSFLNLTVGELKKSEEIEVPIIVRFSPWLAADSDVLVLSLLKSIVDEIKRNLIVPGLSGDATRYARTLLSVVPWTEKLKDLVVAPSQEARIDGLVKHISRVRRRVLVVLDDLDRMEGKELETVLKLLRGSDRLSNITFLCAFDKAEVVLILETTRPLQKASIFIEKFFPVEFRLPAIDSAQLREFFSQRMTRVLEHNAIPHAKGLKSVEKIWDDGADLHFQNLRKIKLFFNKIDRSLAPIAHEVNIEDFIRLELIRDIAPDLYDRIYRKREYYWNQSFAFEVGFRDPSLLDKEDARKEREAEYTKVEAIVPDEKLYVLQLLADMFPYFASYRKKFTTNTVSSTEAEKDKRIFHPRCFRQYFLSKVPSELYPQKEFEKFLSSVRQMSEEDAARLFTKTFQSVVSEDFKRWHFMHLIENQFNEVELQAAKGLCRGMARNSALWQFDAFELMIAIDATHKTLKSIIDDVERVELLRAIVRESTSPLYTLSLVSRLEQMIKADPLMLAEGEQFKARGFYSSENETNKKLLSNLQTVKGYIEEQLREYYLAPEAPSVFEQFGSFGSSVNRIEPNIVLVEWNRLGSGAATDQREYLRNLFTRKPKDLDAFLKLMIRVDFIDDYTGLKILIDYKDLSEMITLNEGALDQEKVSKFRERYNAEGSQLGTKSFVS
jgi:hypothetical protein